MNVPTERKPGHAIALLALVALAWVLLRRRNDRPGFHHAMANRRAHRDPAVRRNESEEK